MKRGIFNLALFQVTLIKIYTLIVSVVNNDFDQFNLFWYYFSPFMLWKARRVENHVWKFYNSLKSKKCNRSWIQIKHTYLFYLYPVSVGRKLNIHKTFKRRPARLLNVLCTFSLYPVSTGWLVSYSTSKLLLILVIAFFLIC